MLEKKELFSTSRCMAGIYKTSGIILPGRDRNSLSFVDEVRGVFKKIKKIIESEGGRNKGWKSVWDVVMVTAVPHEKWEEVQEIVNRQYSEQVLSSFGPDDQLPTRMFTNVLNLPKGARFEMQIQFN